MDMSDAVFEMEPLLNFQLLVEACGILRSAPKSLSLFWRTPLVELKQDSNATEACDNHIIFGRNGRCWRFNRNHIGCLLFVASSQARPAGPRYSSVAHCNDSHECVFCISSHCEKTEASSVSDSSARNIPQSLSLLTRFSVYRQTRCDSSAPTGWSIGYELRNKRISRLH
jgi:hypothetical protein